MSSDGIKSDRSGLNGGKVTINDVARLAGVSKKTVSRVINESPLVGDATRDRIKKIIDETGYTPDPQARALALRRSFLIGMIYDNPSPQYVVNMQLGILDRIQDTSFQLVLHPCVRGAPDNHARIMRFITQQRPYGVVLSPSVSEDSALCAMLRAHDCPYVRIACVEFDEPHENVRTFDVEGAAEAGAHLAALGHRRVAHVHGIKGFRSAGERMAGFEQGLKAHKVKLLKKYIVEGAYTFESGQAAAAKLLAMPDRPTAIFLGNDEMALGAYRAVRAAGLRVPDDISVVGFDDSPMAARVWPPMTSVRLPIRQMGEAAADLLLAAGAGKVVRDRVTFAAELVERQSTAPPKPD